MKFKNRYLHIFVLIIIILFVCVGCGNTRKEEQLIYRQTGITYLENKQYEKALEAFQSALDLSLGELGEEEIDICFYKAETLYMLGDTQGALDTYTAIIDYNQSAKAYFLRGNLYYSLGEEDSALADYEAATEEEKKDYELYIGIYESLVAHDKEKMGEDYLRQALEISGNKSYDKMQKGRIHFLLEENETAISLLEEAIEKKEMLAHYYMAEINVEMEDLEAAEANIQAYIESDVANSYNLFQAGNKQLENGNYKMAIQCLEAALKLEKVPNKQTIMKTLVIVYEYNGDFKKAKSLMAEYVAAYPEDKEAAREYTFLQTR